MAVNGLVTMTPTSIASTGTGNSSSINTNGSVTFSTCATLSLNGVFTSGYDNYMISLRFIDSSASGNFVAMRLRASGAIDTNNYTTQELFAGATTLTPARTATNQWRLAWTSVTQRDGATIYVFGPFLNQTTVFRSVCVAGESNAILFDAAGTHSQASSYDGFTFYPANAGSGLITVYGFNQ